MYLDEPSLNYFELKPADQDSITSISLPLLSSTLCCDQMPKVGRRKSNHLLGPLKTKHTMFNVCLLTGVFSDELFIADVSNVSRLFMFIICEKMEDFNLFLNLLKHIAHCEIKRKIKICY